MTPAARAGTLRGALEPTPRPSITLAEATRADLSVLACNSLLIAFRQRHGEAALEQALVGLPVSPKFLEDRRKWISFRLYQLILDRLCEADGGANFARAAGRITASEGALGFTFSVMRAVASPRALYRGLFANAHVYNRVGRFEVVSLNDTSCELVYVPLREEWNDSEHGLEHRLGQFEAMPTVFGLPVAHVTVSLEPSNGIVAVRYRLHWLPLRRPEWRDPRPWLAAIAVGALAWKFQTRLVQSGPPPGTLAPLVTFMLVWGMLRLRRGPQEARRQVMLLEAMLDESRAQHEELAAANLALLNMRVDLERKVESQDQELARRFEALQAAYASLEQLATRDSLTGLFTRRAGDEALVGLSTAHRDSGQPLALCLFDVDHFKSVNDTWGHAAGDKVLVAIGRLLLELPQPIRAARYGGEEFLIIFPGHDVSAARGVVDALVARMRALAPITAAPERTIRVSGGLVSLDGGAPEDAVRRADALLYAAKQRGRDRILDDLSSSPRPGTPGWTLHPPPHPTDKREPTAPSPDAPAGAPARSGTNDGALEAAERAAEPGMQAPPMRSTASS